MEATLFALLTAVCIGAGDFSGHFGLRHLKALPGAFFALCFQLITISVAIVLLSSWEIVDWRGPVFMLLSGILHPGAFFFVLLTAIDRLGPARAITLKATSPFFGVAVAIFLLGERPDFQVFAGLFLAGGGVMSLTSEKREKVSSKWGFIFPLAAAFLSGLAPNVAKIGLQYLPNPMLGPFFAVSGGIVTLFIVNTFLSRGEEGAFWLWNSPAKGIVMFIPMGILAALGWIFYFTALLYGPVSQVMPLVHTAPFVAMLLSRIMIQEYERVDLRLVLSAVSIFAGVFLITMGKA